MEVWGGGGGEGGGGGGGEGISGGFFFFFKDSTVADGWRQLSSTARVAPWSHSSGADMLQS